LKIGQHLRDREHDLEAPFQQFIFTGQGDGLSKDENCLLVNGDRIEHVGHAHDDVVLQAKEAGVKEHDVGDVLSLLASSMVTCLS